MASGQIIRPFGERVMGKVVVRNSAGVSRAWEDFGVTSGVTLVGRRRVAKLNGLLNYVTCRDHTGSSLEAFWCQYCRYNVWVKRGRDRMFIRSLVLSLYSANSRPP
jgi:hypothetical protein